MKLWLVLLALMLAGAFGPTVISFAFAAITVVFETLVSDWNSALNPEYPSMDRFYYIGRVLAWVLVIPVAIGAFYWLYRVIAVLAEMGAR